MMTEFADQQLIATALSEGKHVHMLGIGGVGMAGLAILLKSRGLYVSGCDVTGGRVSEWLKTEGIEVLEGHDPAHISDEVDVVIRSAAVAESAPEVQRAKTKGVPVFRRGEVLPAMLSGRKSIAVSGTHGKTSTTAMIAHILESEGLNPTYCIGGEIDDRGRVARCGDPSLLLVEADESDGTLAVYRPTVGVITNVEFDHMEHFRDEEEFLACFGQFAGRVAGPLIAGIDSPLCRGVIDGMDNVQTFGLSENADIRGVISYTESGKTEFHLIMNGVAGVRLSLPVDGVHNVLNALAAIAVAGACGVDPVSAAFHLRDFKPVRRRFERICEAGGVLVVSDYAHHPTEIAAVLGSAARQEARRVIALFQPHRYTRTLALGPCFPAAFQGVDELILAPVYPASEEPLEGGTSADLAVFFKKEFANPLHMADSLDDSFSILKSIVTSGDLVLIVGAGDVESIAFRLRDHLTESGL